MSLEALAKHKIIDQYFDRVEVKGKPFLKRKSDLVEIPLFHFAFYNESQIESVGKGEFTPTFLSE